MYAKFILQQACSLGSGDPYRLGVINFILKLCTLTVRIWKLDSSITRRSSECTQLLHQKPNKAIDHSSSAKEPTTTHPPPNRDSQRC